MSPLRNAVAQCQYGDIQELPERQKLVGGAFIMPLLVPADDIIRLQPHVGLLWKLEIGCTRGELVHPP
jgi:hypothetical protein